MTRRVTVYSDGENELGHAEDVDLEPASLPSLGVLVHRLLEGPAHVRYQCKYLKRIRIQDSQIKGKKVKIAHGYRKRVAIAMKKARFSGGALVIVADRDRNRTNDILGPMQEGRDMDPKNYVPCALGLAIETFDAWMITDAMAVQKANGDPSRVHRAPETLDQKEGRGQGHPKDIAAIIFGGKDSLGPRYQAVASHVDLDDLEKCCPRGFAPFAREVRERIKPPLEAARA